MMKHGLTFFIICFVCVCIICFVLVALLSFIGARETLFALKALIANRLEGVGKAPDDESA